MRRKRIYFHRCQPHGSFVVQMLQFSEIEVLGRYGQCFRMRVGLRRLLTSCWHLVCETLLVEGVYWLGSLWWGASKMRSKEGAVATQHCTTMMFTFHIRAFLLAINCFIGTLFHAFVRKSALRVCSSLVSLPLINWTTATRTTPAPRKQTHTPRSIVNHIQCTSSCCNCIV